MMSHRISKPSIKIYYAEALRDKQVLDQILYGIEEEGIPAEAQPCDGNVVEELAYLACQDSILGTGIGISTMSVAVQYDKLKKEEPLFLLSTNTAPDKLRILGANSARLVKKMPFKSM